MSKRNGEIPYTGIDLLTHPGVLNLVQKPDDLVTLSLESGTIVTIGDKPNGEFWTPQSGKVRGGDRLTFTVLTLERDQLAAITFTDADRRLILTKDGMVERVRSKRRDPFFDANTNIESEWDNQGRVQRVHVTHDLPQSNGRGGTSLNAGVEYWQSFGTAKSLLELVDTKLFQPAQTTSAIRFNERMKGYPTELQPGFLLEGGSDELPIKDGWNFRIEWSVNVRKIVSEVWNRGLGELVRSAGR